MLIPLDAKNVPERSQIRKFALRLVEIMLSVGGDLTHVPVIPSQRIARTVLK
jgi:hypothetical protein